ncbi:DUF2254 domain-containing protein [Alkalihalobacterium elongatum]|uniref:DUF2254 domain-containing protein n=1 Tax=Alkalihalobacterium elongatum TaxID=2675466 RepID=UPI001C1FA67E|nr:DUF2254 domain-containing protein [Alkalihalobacterium elongatum]
MLYNIVLKVRKNIWLIPSVYCLLATVLALVIIWLDTVHGEKVEATLPATILISVDLAQTILGTIAAALLTMITITFSTIMVVLTTYSSQFSPRTLSDFVTNKVTMRVLGIYMGGFMYSILSLLFMREDLEHEVMAGTIGVLFSIICLAFFAYFIHFVATSIQVNKLISELTRHTLDTVYKRKKTDKKTEKINITHHKPKLVPETFSKIEVRSQTFGYIQLIQYEYLLKTAIKHNLYIEIVPAIGTFITTGQNLFNVYYLHRRPKTNFHKYIEVGNDRTILQDVDFGIQKVVEVTLRALSPGINDPNTAIDGILHLGKLLAESCKQDGNYITYSDRSVIRVVAPQKTVEEIFYVTFYQICHYGREDISIMLAIYEALIMVAEGNDQQIKNKVWTFSQYINNNFNKEVLQELDLQYLNEKVAQLRALTME